MHRQKVAKVYIQRQPEGQSGTAVSTRYLARDRAPKILTRVKAEAVQAELGYCNVSQPGPRAATCKRQQQNKRAKPHPSMQPNAHAGQDPLEPFAVVHRALDVAERPLKAGLLRRRTLGAVQAAEQRRDDPAQPLARRWHRNQQAKPNSERVEHEPRKQLQRHEHHQ
eukprot:5911852-Prymnesium_polylepis.1